MLGFWRQKVRNYTAVLVRVPSKISAWSILRTCPFFCDRHPNLPWRTAIWKRQMRRKSESESWNHSRKGGRKSRKLWVPPEMGAFVLRSDVVNCFYPSLKHETKLSFYEPSTSINGYFLASLRCVFPTFDWLPWKHVSLLSKNSLDWLFDFLVKDLTIMSFYHLTASGSPSFLSYKSEGMLPTNLETLFNLVYPGVEKPRRKEWDNAVTSASVIDKPAPVFQHQHF